MNGMDEKIRELVKAKNEAGRLADKRAKQLYDSIFSHVKTTAKARVYLGTNQENLTTGTWTKVLLNQEDYDPGNNFDNATNYRFIAPEPGYYDIKGTVTFLETIADKVYMAALYKDDTAARIFYAHASFAGYLSAIAADHLYLAKDSYIELWAQQNSGVSTVDLLANETCLAIHLISI